jgi:hypothetical protein
MAEIPIIPIIPIRPIPFPIGISGPTISSLEPSGASAGGAPFTLTITGNGFAGTSVVQWNGTSLPTTFVSATQLTSPIAAAAIATAGSASVLVSNGANSNSGAVTFLIIPDINTIVTQLNQVTQTFAAPTAFTAIQPSVVTALNDLKTYLTNQSSADSALQNQLGSTQAQVANLNTQNSALTSQVAQQQAQITQLQAQVAAAKNQTAAPLDVAQSFKAVLDTIHQASLTGSGPQTTLTNLNIQLKALVSVQQPVASPNDTSGTVPPLQALLVFPDPTALPDANAMSTVSFSFSPVPRLSSATSPPPAPTPPAPAPAAAPSTSKAEG